MKMLKTFILKNWFWITVGCVLTRKVAEMEYVRRGYLAIGGEWLILPVLLFCVELSRNIGNYISEIMQMEMEK